MSVTVRPLPAICSRALVTILPGLMVAFWALESGAVQDNGPDLREAAIFASVLMNADALRQGDVLISETVSVDTVTEKPDFNPDGVAKSTQMLIRFVFDHDAGKYCVLRKGRYLTLDLGEVGSGRNPERNTDVIRAGSVSGPDSPIMIRDFPGPTKTIPVRMRQAMTVSILRYLMAPEIRVLPMVAMMEEDYAFVRDYVIRLQTGAGLRRASRLNATRLELTSFVDYPGGARPGTALGVEWKYEFDLENSLPVRITAEIKLPAGAAEKELGPSVTTASWLAMNGIQVLDQMESRGIRPVRINGQYHHGESLTQLRFHWFSVNEPLKDQFFDGTCFQDLETFQAHIDPVKSGADSLIRPDPAGTGGFKPEAFRQLERGSEGSASTCGVNCLTAQRACMQRKQRLRNWSKTTSQILGG